MPDEPAAAAEPPPSAKKKAGGIVLALVMLAMVGVIIVMILQRQPTAKGTEIPEGIEITITAPRPTTVKIDGVPSGRTPVSIRLKGSKRTLKIEGNGVTKEILADRDQTVDLVKP
jgi:diacylglycerol kinase family enzyme